MFDLVQILPEKISIISTCNPNCRAFKIPKKLLQSGEGRKIVDLQVKTETNGDKVSDFLSFADMETLFILKEAISGKLTRPQNIRLLAVTGQLHWKPNYRGKSIMLMGDLTDWKQEFNRALVLFLWWGNPNQGILKRKQGQLRLKSFCNSNESLEIPGITSNQLFRFHIIQLLTKTVILEGFYVFSLSTTPLLYWIHKSGTTAKLKKRN